MESTDFCFENKYVHPSSVVFKTSLYEMMKAVVDGLLCGWLIVAMTVSVTFLLGKVKVDHPCIPQEQHALRECSVDVDCVFTKLIFCSFTLWEAVKSAILRSFYG